MDSDIMELKLLISKSDLLCMVEENRKRLLKKHNLCFILEKPLRKGLNNGTNLWWQNLKEDQRLKYLSFKTFSGPTKNKRIETRVKNSDFFK